MPADYKALNKSIESFYSFGNIAANTVRYISPGANAAGENNAELPMPGDGIILGINIHAGNFPGAGEAFDYMVRLNRADTILFCQAAGAAVSTAQASAGVAFSRGDMIDIRLTTSLNAVVTFHYMTLVIKFA